MKLVTMMAQACMYAQNHIDDLQAWSVKAADREHLLQCVSYQMACFIAQNTGKGGQGVEWAVILEELIEHPAKTEAEWEKILNEIALEYGGWKGGMPEKFKVSVVKRLYCTGAVEVEASDEDTAIDLVQSQIERAELQTTDVDWGDPVYEDFSFEATGDVD